MCMVAYTLIFLMAHRMVLYVGNVNCYYLKSILQRRGVVLIIKNIGKLQLSVIRDIVQFIRDNGTKKSLRTDFWITEHDGVQRLITKSGVLFKLYGFLPDEGLFLKDFKKASENIEAFDVLDFVEDIPQIRVVLQDTWLDQIMFGEKE